MQFQFPKLISFGNFKLFEYVNFKLFKHSEKEKYFVLLQPVFKCIESLY